MAKCVSTHEAYISDRGGQRRIGQLKDISRVTWDRRRDETSEAEIVLQGGACTDQADFLRQIEPKRSELVIYRGKDRVWEGPVNRVAWDSTQVKIVAKDVSDYIFGRPLTKEWDNSYDTVNDVNRATEVTTRMGQILDYEMATPFTLVTASGSEVIPAWEALNPPANVLPFVEIHHFPNEVRTAAKTLPFQYTIGEHLDNYAHTGGIDYTVVGRGLHIWDTSRPLGRGRILTEADFYGDIIVTAYGSDFAAIGYAVAHDGTYGGAGANDPYYGPWTKLFTVYDEDESVEAPSDVELRSQAQRNLTGRNPVPVEVRVPDNSSLRLNKGLTINDLVPGTVFPLLATLNSRVMSQEQKLHKVTVVETPEREDVKIVLVPAAKEDSDIEGGA